MLQGRGLKVPALVLETETAACGKFDSSVAGGGAVTAEQGH